MSHLDYYRKHDIAPVRYDLSDVDAHLQRRAALYRGLGLLPLAVRGADVLEVAAGTGQNSLYLASLLPASLTLVEPNPAGLRAIAAAYAGFERPHTAPVLIDTRLEDYAPAGAFDVVLCENWLGASAHERALLRKLAGLVRPQGVLIVTFIAPEGLLPNVLRRALSVLLARPDLPFDQRTEILVEAFAPHLGTIRGMTRSAVDWVHDNMMNPAYFDLCLTLPMALAEVGSGFQAVGTSPVFRRDWRWFKALHGERFEFNAALLAEYRRLAACFLDHRVEDPAGAPAGWLHDETLALLDEVRHWEAAVAAQGTQALALQAAVSARARGIAGRLEATSPGLAFAANEACALLDSDRVDPRQVAGLQQFASWFGRETLYLSLERTGMAGQGGGVA